LIGLFCKTALNVFSSLLNDLSPAQLTQWSFLATGIVIATYEAARNAT